MGNITKEIYTQENQLEPNCQPEFKYFYCIVFLNWVLNKIPKTASSSLAGKLLFISQ